MTLLRQKYVCPVCRNPATGALLAAERDAPAEVRYRLPVHRMTEDLLRADSTLPRLRDFAHRIGLPTT